MADQIIEPFQVGDRVRIKGNLSNDKPDGSKYVSNSLFEKLQALKGKLRTVSYVYSHSEPDGSYRYTIQMRGLGWNTPADWVEAYRKPTKEPIKLNPEQVTSNSILGQDKIKKQLKYAVSQDIPALLIGETGTGKTTIVKDLATAQGKQWLRYNLTGETTVDEFLGKYTLENGETKWQDGVLLQAMKQGLWLIVDEINVALPEILFVLHSLLDDDKSVMVAQHDGEVVKPHADFRFFATMNPVDEYAGTKDLNKAFMSRFGMIVKIDYPKPEYEKAILIHKGGASPEVANQLVDIGLTLRKAKADSEIFYTCSTRDLIQLAKLAEPLGLPDALQLTVVNKANGDGAKIKELIKHIVSVYTDTEKQFGTLNIDTIRQQIAEVTQSLEVKQLEVREAERDIEHKNQLIEAKEAELVNKEAQMRKDIKIEILQALNA